MFAPGARARYVSAYKTCADIICTSSFIAELKNGLSEYLIQVK